MARQVLVLSGVRLERFTAVTVAAALAACANAGSTSDPNAGLLRDFLDGKFDGAGHPINAIVTEAETLCQGSVSDGAVELAAACSGSVNGGQQVGDLIASARLRVDAHAASGLIATIDVTDNGATLATTTLTVETLRSDGAWLDVPVAWSSNGDAIGIRVTPAAGAQLAFDYVEVFPSRFGLVISPGAGVVADSDHVTFEIPADRALDRVEVDGVDVTAQVTAIATVQTTAYRKLYDLAVSDLAPDRGDVADVRVDAAETAARTTLRRTVPSCNYEGNGATKVLVTGFQPFPADGTHDNVSGVAVTALDPSSLRGAQRDAARDPGRVRPRARRGHRRDRALRSRHRDQLRPGRRCDRARADRVQPARHRRGHRRRARQPRHHPRRAADRQRRRGDPRHLAPARRDRRRARRARRSAAAEHRPRPLRLQQRHVRRPRRDDRHGAPASSTCRTPSNSTTRMRARFGKIVAAAIQATVDAD